MRMLERVLIGKLETYRPNGFNSVNEASEFELPLTDETFSLFEEMDTRIAETDKAADLLDMLNEAMKSERYTEKTKELI